MKVAFLAPNIGHVGTFYEVFADFLQAAARQLQIELEVVDSGRRRAPAAWPTRPGCCRWASSPASTLRRGTPAAGAGRR